MMRSLIATLLSASFSLQLALTASNLCAMPQDEGASPTGQPQTEVSAMPGMAMSVPLDRVALVVSDTESSPSDSPSRPCDEPAIPPSGQCVAPCSATFTTATSVQSNETVHHPTRAPTTTVLEPASRSESPEPPPPRV